MYKTQLIVSVKSVVVPYVMGANPYDIYVSGPCDPHDIPTTQVASYWNNAHGGNEYDSIKHDT